MSPQKHRRTFISYSRTNKEFALELALELRSSGFNIWLDQLDIPTGARWDDEIERALEACEIFMVILTPASSKSDNVKDEIGYAIDSGKRILPILLENAKVPLRLRRFQYVDFTKKSYKEGVESAEQLLKKLIEEPTVPRDLSLSGIQMPIVEREESEQAAEYKAQEEKQEDEIKRSFAEAQAPKLYPSPAPQKLESPSASPKKKSRLPMVLGAAGAGTLVVLAFVVFATMNRPGGDTPNTGSADNNLSAENTGAAPAPLMVEAQATNTSAPAPTQEVALATSTLEPTVLPNTPTPGIQKYFTEEFDGELNSWPGFIIDNRRQEPAITNEPSSDVNISFKDGLYHFDIQRRLLTAYSYYDPIEYSDVRVDVRVDSQSIRANTVSLICRYSPEDGWYEFNIANNGGYSIKYVQPKANGTVTYRDIWRGSFSINVKTGNAINEYSIICQDDDLSLIINGELERQTSDNLRILDTGKVGVSVSSINDLPVTVGFDRVTISEPE